MQKFFYLLLAATLFIYSNTHAQGLNFEKGSWSEVVEKAKKEKKLIFLDVYTTWCGPCKLLDKRVFPNKAAGEKYNPLFINFKMDAEKGEGRKIAKKYSVGVYPTNLYIDPEDEKVIYKTTGLCSVEEFIKRADLAIAESKDTMTWAMYKTALANHAQDTAFIFKYMNKARSKGKYYDEALDLYVKHHLSEPITNEQLIFLLQNTSNFDNKAYSILAKNEARVNKLVPNQPSFLKNYAKSKLYQGTFKKAVAYKSESILATVKPIINELAATDKQGTWHWIRTRFYKTLGEDKNFLNSLKDACKTYLDVSSSEIIAKDSALLLINIANLKQQLVNKKVRSSQQEAQIKHTIKRKPDFSKGYSFRGSQLFKEYFTYVTKKEKKLSKNEAKLAFKFAEKYLTLAQPFPNEIQLANQYYIWSALQSKNKKKAITFQQNIIKKLMDKGANLQAASRVLNTIKDGTFNLKK